MERVFRKGLALFRVGAWLWLATTLALYWNTDYLRHKYLALGLVILALVFTVVQTALVPMSIRYVNRRRVAAGEMVVALALMTLDGFVRRPNVVFETGPTLGSYWPVISLVSAATYLPFWAAALAGISFAVARAISTTLNQEPLSQLTSSEQLSIVATGVFAGLLAVSISGLVKLLRSAESEVALARAREEVARTLHDGVLQTLSIVERRTTDDKLATLVRKQERELRQFLFGQRSSGADQELGGALLEAANRFEAVFGGRVEIVVASDVPELPADKRHALLGAVGEALTNAGKHGNAQTVTVYVEPDEDETGIFCSVKDDGVGFDPSAIVPGVGLGRSIRGRMEEAGGRVEIKGGLGHGTEILLWLK